MVKVGQPIPVRSTSQQAEGTVYVEGEEVLERKEGNEGAKNESKWGEVTRRMDRRFIVGRLTVDDADAPIGRSVVVKRFPKQVVTRRRPGGWWYQFTYSKNPTGGRTPTSFSGGMACSAVVVVAGCVRTVDADCVGAKAASDAATRKILSNAMDFIVFG